MARKTTNTFLTALAIASIMGFLVIVLNSFFSIDFGEFIPSILMVIFGLAFLVEGQVRLWFNKFKTGGYSSTEVTHIITGSVGITALVTGVIGFFVEGNTTFTALQGIIAVIAILVIAIETWVVN